MRRVSTSALATLLALSAFSARAQDCPTAQTAPRGFVVERGDKQKTDVLLSDDGTVRTTMRYDGPPLLKTSCLPGCFH
jgi:hypothetical protein